MDNELLLIDRIGVIKDTINKYGEENFYLSFSGGKDSTILHYLIDQALPNNKIPRVFVDTGLEYNLLKDFVYELAQNDERIVILKPNVAIQKMLEDKGYPFKSKDFSSKVDIYQRNGKLLEGLKRWLSFSQSSVSCPNKLRYLFESLDNLRISDKCCLIRKEQPMKNWAIQNHKTIAIIGITGDEKGRRNQYTNNCFVKTKKDNFLFYPLRKIDKEFEEWFIETNNITLCKLYYPPYNFERTGCKGCPFSKTLQKDLEILEKYFPNERQQCEIIWKPVYDEYRRLNYRLKNVEKIKLF